MALASPRACAQIISLPGAAAAPVTNQPHPRGRYTKGITPLARGKVLRRDRLSAERARHARALVPTRPAATPAPLPVGAWPFESITREQFACLSERDRGRVEGHIAYWLQEAGYV